MNIVLIGFRGVGKSSVAELVASSTNRTLFRLDDEIERRAGCSVTEIVRQHGWEHFRELECAVCAEAGEMANTVIDAGGGVVLRPENVAALKANGTVFWLTAQADTIRKRIKHDGNRPALTNNDSFIDEIEDVLKARMPLYESAADYVIHTDNRTLGDVGDEIAHIVRTSL